MSVRKLNGRYVVEFELRRHRVFRRLPAGAKKGQADELETRLRSELIDQAVLGKKPKVSVGYVLEAWRDEVLEKRKKSRNEGLSKARLTLAGLEKLNLKNRPVDDVQEVAGELVELWEGLAPATINRRLCALKGACKWAWKLKRWTHFNLSPFVQLLEGEVPRTRTIPQAVIDALIARAEDPETKAFIALGSYALMRQGEVMRVQPEDVAGGGIRIRDWDDRVRVVSIEPQLRPHLKSLPLTLHKRTLYERFEAARDALEIEDLVYHDLRRSGGTILLNRGVPLEVVSHIMGHKDLETTRRVYAHILPDTVKRAMRRGFRPIKNPSGEGGPGGI